MGSAGVTVPKSVGRTRPPLFVLEVLDAPLSTLPAKSRRRGKIQGDGLINGQVLNKCCASSRRGSNDSGPDRVTSAGADAREVVLVVRVLLGPSAFRIECSTSLTNVRELPVGDCEVNTSLENWTCTASATVNTNPSNSSTVVAQWGGKRWRYQWQR